MVFVSVDVFSERRAESIERAKQSFPNFGFLGFRKLRGCRCEERGRGRGRCRMAE